MLFDGEVKKLRINGLVSKSFPCKKHVRIQRGGAGGQSRPSPENHKAALNVGPAKLSLGGGGGGGGVAMLARILWYLDPLSSQQLKKQNKKLKVGPLWQNFLDPRMRR